MSGIDPAALTYDADGLLPVVVQDVASGAVLMVAWADREAVTRTLESGEGWFWSRSRQESWRKGATSGNLLSVVEVRADCDGDTLLYRVDPAGPACHTGERTCFEGDHQIIGGGQGGDGPGPTAEADGNQPLLELGWLWRILEERRAGGSRESYTSRLLAAGVDRVARKVGEEATETVIAALRAADAVAAASEAPDGPAGDGAAGGGEAVARRRELAGEAADLLYHLLVLLMAAGASPADVAAELRRRHAAPNSPAVPKPEAAPGGTE